MAKISGHSFVGEVSAGIEFEVDVAPSGTGSIVRNGEEVTQRLRKLTTKDIAGGVVFVNRTDSQTYEIVSADGTAGSATIRRQGDSAEFSVSYKELKQFATLIEYAKVHGV